MSDPVTVRASATLQQVACVMIEHDVDAVAVLDGRGSVCGAITAAALTLSQQYLRLAGVANPRLHGLWFAPEDMVEEAANAAKAITAHSYMQRWFISANATEPLGSVVKRMLHEQTEHAFVLEDGKLVGMLGRRDLLGVMAHQGPLSRSRPRAK